MPKQLTGYELSRSWFDFAFENPEVISPNHAALFFFCIEHCNRLGWKEKFGLPSAMAKDAIGIRSYNTYINTLNDLVKWGFIKLHEKSKNQYSSNIIALSKNNKANTKALDKAMIKYKRKQREQIGESTNESNDTIIKPLTIQPINNQQGNKETNPRTQLLNEWFEKALTDEWVKEAFCMKARCDPADFEMGLTEFFKTKKISEVWTDEKDFRDHLINWAFYWKKEIKNGNRNFNKTESTTGANTEKLRRIVAGEL